jgi:hypothetical protein
MTKELTPEQAATPAGSRSGLVLAFALAILVLMSLMGIIILSNTRTELNITGNSRLGREAFNSADATARMATFLTLVLMSPKTENINDVITNVPTSPAPLYPIHVCMQPKFNLEDLISDATNFDFTRRYMETGAGDGSTDPHIIFKLGPCNSSSSRELANAVVNLETFNLIPDGMGLGTGDPNDTSGGPKLQVGVVVSVNAKTFENVTAGADDPNSIITVMYRNYMN